MNNRKPLQLLTHSRQDTWKTCRRKHYYAYDLGMRPIHDARALRMGSAFDDGVSTLGRGESTDAACEAVNSHYAKIPDHFDPFDWLMERETILRLVCAYAWRWSTSGIVNVGTQTAFQIPLVNPATGAATPIFDLAGKIDGIVRLEDGRLAVKETKTCSEDISPHSEYWRRLRMDHQISLYIHAARQMGYTVDTVLYDVVRKPSIAPTDVPELDSAGLKIVVDEHGERVRNVKGGTWRQTADKEKGYVVKSRLMTTQEWGDKLTADIVERPEFYFARMEIPRLDQDIADYQSEIWEIQLSIRDAQRTGRHYRTVNRNTCPYCPYFDLCSTNAKVSKDRPPEGFVFLDNPHPELNGERFHVNATSTAATNTAPGESVKTSDPASAT